MNTETRCGQHFKWEPLSVDGAAVTPACWKALTQQLQSYRSQEEHGNKEGKRLLRSQNQFSKRHTLKLMHLTYKGAS